MGEQVAALIWGCSSVGRAPALQAGGHEFESHHLHDDNEANNPAGFLRKPKGCLHTERLTYKSLKGYSKSIRDEKARRALNPDYKRSELSLHCTLKTEH